MKIFRALILLSTQNQHLSLVEGHAKSNLGGLIMQVSSGYKPLIFLIVLSKNLIGVGPRSISSSDGLSSILDLNHTDLVLKSALVEIFSRR